MSDADFIDSRSIEVETILRAIRPKLTEEEIAAAIAAGIQFRRPEPKRKARREAIGRFLGQVLRGFLKR